MVASKLKTLKSINSKNVGQGFDFQPEREATNLPLSSLQKQKTFRKKLLKKITPSENRMVNYLSSNIKIKFKFQYLIYPYIADFYFPTKRLVVELDGSVHNSKKAKAHDTKKESYFASIGIFTEHLKNNKFSKVKELLAIYPDITPDNKYKIDRCINILSHKLRNKVIKIVEPTDVSEVFDMIREIKKRNKMVSRQMKSNKLDFEPNSVCLPTITAH